MALVALGSLLPDIIDKPLGYILFGSPGNGRIIAHTLLFLLCLMALATMLRSRGLMALSGGVASHLILDSIWRTPVILFWPLFGGFIINPPMDVSDYLGMLMQALHNPFVSVPEGLGLAYLLYFCWVRRASMASFAEAKRRALFCRTSDDDSRIRI